MLVYQRVYPQKNGGSPKQRCPKKLVVPKKIIPKWKFHVVPQFHQGTKVSSKIYSLGWCQFRCRALGFFPRQRFDSTKKLVRLPTKHRDFMRLPNGFQLIWSGWRWRCRSGDPILGNLTWTHTHWHLRNLVWGSCIWVISNKDEQLLFGGRCINHHQSLAKLLLSLGILILGMEAVKKRLCLQWHDFPSAQVPGVHARCILEISHGFRPMAPCSKASWRPSPNRPQMSCGSPWVSWRFPRLSQMLPSITMMVVMMMVMMMMMMMMMAVVVMVAVMVMVMMTVLMCSPASGPWRSWFESGHMSGLWVQPIFDQQKDMISLHLFEANHCHSYMKL